MGALMGSDVRLAGPSDLGPPDDVVRIAEGIAAGTGARIIVTDDVHAAVAGTDFVHTDVWVSMGEADSVWAERIEIKIAVEAEADAQIVLQLTCVVHRKRDRRDARLFR